MQSSPGHPTHGLTNVGRPAKTYSLHVCEHWMPGRGPAKSDRQ